MQQLERLKLVSSIFMYFTKKTFKTIKNASHFTENILFDLKISIFLYFPLPLLLTANWWSTYRNCTIMLHHRLLKHKQTLKCLHKLQKYLQAYEVRDKYLYTVFLYHLLLFHVKRFWKNLKKIWTEKSFEYNWLAQILFEPCRV